MDEDVGVGEKEPSGCGRRTPMWVRDATAGQGGSHGRVGVGQCASAEEIRMGRRKRG